MQIYRKYWWKKGSFYNCSACALYNMHPSRPKQIQKKKIKIGFHCIGKYKSVCIFALVARTRCSVLCNKWKGKVMQPINNNDTQWMVQCHIERVYNCISRHNTTFRIPDLDFDIFNSIQLRTTMRAKRSKSKRVKVVIVIVAVTCFVCQG